MTTVFLIIAVFGLVTHLAAALSLVKVLRQRPRRTSSRPVVSILKPLKGLDDQLEENLETFFTLDYPNYELIFCAADSNEPALRVVERLRTRHPDVPSRIVTGAAPIGLNPKVKVLAHATKFSRGEIVVVSDSNVRVRSSFLLETLSELDDPSVAVVSNIVAGVGERTVGASLENLQLDGFIAPAICFGLTLRLGSCVVGKSMSLRRTDLDAIGGWATFGNVLAEDFVMGRKLTEIKRRAAVSTHVVETVNEHWTLGRFVERHGRWLKMRWRINPFIMIWELLSNVTVWAVLAALTAGDSLPALAAAGLILVGRALLDLTTSTFLRPSAPELLQFLLVPVRDFLLAALWFVGIFSRRIRWREGQHLLIGRHSELSLPPEFDSTANVSSIPEPRVEAALTSALRR